MLTGESMPVTKTQSDKVFAGTTNLNGQLVVTVRATGEETELSHIVAAVQRAQTSRAEIQRLGDRVSNVFVPVVVIIAIATAIWWGVFFPTAQHVHALLFPSFVMHHLPSAALAAALIHASAVLIIACPCAMGLATPAAIMAGTNVAAQRGILIRDGIALEKAGKITAVVFDKTGTLTEGKPALVATKVFAADIPNVMVNDLVASLARHSNHPLSRVIANISANDSNLSQWQEVRGAGVQGNVTIAGKPSLARLGSLAWLSGSSVNVMANEFATEWMAKGATILGLSIDDKLVAQFALQDSLKANAAQVSQQLRDKGLNVYLLTGDNHRTAHAIAAQTGIAAANVFAEIRPEQKASIIKDLQQHGQRVAFVGDGINDAPALEQADLGIAVAKASDVASEAADIVLLNSDLSAVTETLDLASATLRVIKQNLFWAFFYNAAGVPLAALGFVSPMLCAAAMGLSDVVVIGNALRLRLWRPRKK
jgi:Cu+-exporting ATPase